MFPSYSLLNMKVICMYMAFPAPDISVGWLILKICQNVLITKFFLTFVVDKPLSVELKTNQGVIFITILLSFHYFISLETANTQKSEVLLLSISLGNVHVSIVTC